MENHTLGGLRKILVASSDFYDIQDYFLTLTETNFAAIEGKSGKNNVLKEIITTTLTEICLRQALIDPESKIMLVSLKMVEVRQRHFWHGSGLVNGKFIFTFFYFADLDKGMISISTKNGNNFFARVSVKSVPNDSNPLDDFSQN
jgi:hypothetical protein